MTEDGRAGVPPGCIAGSESDQLSSLRGELWRRHALLRGRSPDGADYQNDIVTVLELTSELLRAEHADGERVRRDRRWPARLGRLGRLPARPNDGVSS